MPPKRYSSPDSCLRTVPTGPRISGYDEPYRFEYPVQWIQVGVVGLALLAFGGSLRLASLLRGAPVDVEVDLPLLVVAAAVVPVTVVVHETIHGVAAGLLGYRVTYGIDRSIPAAYAGSFRQRIARRDNAVVAAAPFVAGTVGCAALLPFVDGLVLVAVIAALVVNAAVAVGDLYLLYRLGRLPAGSVLYDASIDEMLVFEPTTVDTEDPGR